MSQSHAAVAPLILAVAPNGARRTQADHPALPMTAGEIARCAAACREAGAAMIHLHVRDAAGRHLLDAAAYKEATAAIRREAGADLIVQITTEAVGLYKPEEQMRVVRETRPEACSLALREIVPDAASERAAFEFLKWLGRERITAQYILYSAAEVARARELYRRGIIPDARPFSMYVLGRYAAGQRSEPKDLLPYLAAGDAATPWMMCAFGAREAACGLAAAAFGGHVRVGFENNLHLADGAVAPDNAALVAQTALGARAIGRPVADGIAARALLSG